MKYINFGIWILLSGEAYLVCLVLGYLQFLDIIMLLKILLIWIIISLLIFIYLNRDEIIITWVW